MPEWLTFISVLVGLGGGTFGAVNGYRTMKRTSPIEEIKQQTQDKWKTFYDEKWDKAVERLERLEETVRNVDSERTRRRFEELDNKLDNDNRRIAAITETTKTQQRFLVLLLKSQQLSLVHMADGNHTGQLHQASEEIQTFLLNEATRCDI